MEESVVRVDHAVASYSKIIEFRQNDVYSDIEFRVQEKSFKCHRLVLGAASEYFHVMFTGKFKESKESVVPLEGISAGTFEIVLQFIYTGNASICTANLYELFHASEYYKLPGLETMCIQYIRESARPFVEGVLQLYSFFHTTSKKEAAKSLDENIFDHFDYFYRTPEFLKIPIDDLCRILEKVNKGDRQPTIQNIFHRAIVRWTKYATSHSPEERKSYSKRLVEKIDCTRLSGQYLEYMTRWYIEHDGNTVEDEIIYSEAKKSLVKPLCLQAFVKNEGSKPRFQSFVFSYDDAHSYSGRWNCSYNSRNHLFDFMRTSEVNNFLYCLSYVKNPKEENATMESSSQKFITTSSVSLFPRSYLTPPPLILQNFDMCEIHGNIYVYNKNAQSNAIHNVESSAKFDEEELARAVYLYNTETDMWLPVPPLEQKFSNACMSSDKQMLYLVGGTNSNKYVQGYDYRTSKWIALAPTSGIYERAACVCVSNEELYVSGGCQNPKKVEMYNPTAGKWYDEMNLKENMYNHEMLVDEDDDCITYNDYISPDTHVFTIADNSWSSCMYDDLSQFTLYESDKLKIIHMTPFKLYGL